MAPTDRWDSLLAHWWSVAMVGVSMDPSWLLGKAQMLAESGGDPSAKSSTGAVGLFQLEPEAAGEVLVTDRTNPEENVRGGLLYLRRCYETFRQEKDIERWKFALASYNAGAKSIIRAQILAAQRGYETSQWVSIVNVLHDVTSHDNAAQTTQYVAKILQTYNDLKGEQT